MTTMIRWNPIREMAAMQNAMDRLFDETWRAATNGQATGSYSLALDVYENEDAYIVHAALPGVQADQINVRLHEGTLTISAELPRVEQPENTRTLLRERPTGTFSRSITLPQVVNADDVEATYEDGILTLTLPKAAEAKPRTIQIKSNSKLLHSNN